MADTGVISPAAATDNASVGTVAWSNVNNIFSSNNSYSDVTLTGSNTTVDTYSDANRDNGYAMYTGNYINWGQSFECTALTQLKEATFYLFKTGTITGNATAKLYAHTGTFGTSSKPTGSPLATSDNYDVSGLTGSAQAITFTFSGANRYKMLASTYYVIVVSWSGGDVSNYIAVAHDASSPSHSGNIAGSANGTSWSNFAPDVVFIVTGVTFLTSHYLRAYSFGFTVPTGATITGIKVEIEQSLASGAIGYESEVKIVKADGSIGTTNKSTGASIPTSDTYVTYGGVSDLWGETWTPADINDIDFGVVFSAIGSNLKVQVDHVRITVYYTIPGGGGFFQIM